MRPLWQQQSADAELEALQTDVMRFIAILGLCLAAIFSLVQGVALDQAAQPGPAVSTEVTVAPVTTFEVSAAPAITPASGTPQPADNSRAATSPSAPTPARTPTATPRPREIGFSLEFASEATLLGLLEGGQLRLFALVEGQFWKLDPGSASFSVATAPERYYRMAAETVPRVLHQKLGLSGAAPAGEWGVHLPPHTVEQLQQIMRERSGGKLLIQSDGSLRLEQTQKSQGAKLLPGS